jgi:hypothetical protein
VSRSRSVTLTRHWQSAKRASEPRGAGRQTDSGRADGGRQDTTALALLHTTRRQRRPSVGQTKRGPPHEGRVEAVTARDTLLANLLTHFGRGSWRLGQRSRSLAQGPKVLKPGPHTEHDLDAGCRELTRDSD